MSVENPLQLGTQAASPPPVVEDAERSRLYNLLWIAILVGWILPVASVCGIFVVPVASVVCLAVGPWVGFALAAMSAVRGDRIAARFLVLVAVVVAVGDLVAALVLWGGVATAAAQWLPIEEWISRLPR